MATRTCLVICYAQEINAIPPDFTLSRVLSLLPEICLERSVAVRRRSQVEALTTLVNSLDDHLLGDASIAITFPAETISTIWVPAFTCAGCPAQVTIEKSVPL